MTVNKTVTINAPASIVWDSLTNPNLMKQWMLDTDMEISTDWTIGSPLITKGSLHNTEFINKGIVLQFDPRNVLQYTYLSSLSHLPDKPESYCTIEFRLRPLNKQTDLTVIVSNFPTEAIFKHAEFYWKTTVELLKNRIENNSLQASSNDV